MSSNTKKHPITDDNLEWHWLPHFHTMKNVKWYALPDIIFYREVFVCDQCGQQWTIKTLPFLYRLNRGWRLFWFNIKKQ